MDAVKRFYAYLESEIVDSLQANERMVNVYSEMFKDLKIDQNVDEIFQQLFEKVLHQIK